MKNLTPKRCLNRFFELLRLADCAYAKILKSWDLSLNTTWVLETLFEHTEGVEPSVLAEKTNLLRQTITIILNELEKKSFIVRIPHPSDHRKKTIHLTRQGRTFAEKVIKTIRKMEMNYFAAMTVRERNQLIELMERFHDCIQTEAEKQPGNPSSGKDDLS